MIWVNGLSLFLVVCATLCALAGVMIPTSRLKGRVRLASSLLVGAAFPVMAISQGVMQRKPLLSVVELIAGAFLVWLGLRKYRRDPEGRTPSAQIL